MELIRLYIGKGNGGNGYLFDLTLLGLCLEIKKYKYSKTRFSIYFMDRLIKDYERSPR